MTKIIIRIISVCSWRADRMKSFMNFVTSHFWSRMRFFIINMIVIVTIVNTIIVINIIIIITIVTTIITRPPHRKEPNPWPPRTSSQW